MKQCKYVVILRDFPYNVALFGLVFHNDPLFSYELGLQKIRTGEGLPSLRHPGTCELIPFLPTLLLTSSASGFLRNGKICCGPRATKTRNTKNTHTKKKRNGNSKGRGDDFHRCILKSSGLNKIHSGVIICVCLCFIFSVHLHFSPQKKAMYLWISLDLAREIPFQGWVLVPCYSSSWQGRWCFECLK